MCDRRNRGGVGSRGNSGYNPRRSRCATIMWCCPLQSASGLDAVYPRAPSRVPSRECTCITLRATASIKRLSSWCNCYMHVYVRVHRQYDEGAMVGGEATRWSGATNGRVNIHLSQKSNHLETDISNENMHTRICAKRATVFYANPTNIYQRFRNTP